MAEKKVWDTTFSVLSDADPPVSWEGYIYSMTAVPQGFEDNQRIGDKCTGTSLRVCVYAEPAGQNSTTVPPLQSDPFNNLRLVIFVWKDDDDPGFDDIFDGTDGTSVNTAPLYHLNHDKKVKRKILEDTMLRCTCVYGTDANGNFITQGTWAAPICYNRTINLSKIKGGTSTINFQNGTTTGVNKIYLALIAPHSNVTEAPIRCWNYFFLTRYTFYDM